MEETQTLTMEKAIQTDEGKHLLPLLDYFTSFAQNNERGLLGPVKATENMAVDNMKGLERKVIFEEIAWIEKIEKEKEELREHYEEQIASMKRAFDNERKELLEEISKMTEENCVLINIKCKQYEQELKRKDGFVKECIEKERKGLQESVQQQIAFLAEIEEEIKAILLKLAREKKLSKTYDISKLETELEDKNKRLGKPFLHLLRDTFSDESDKIKKEIQSDDRSCNDLQNKLGNNNSLIITKNSTDRERQVVEEAELVEVGESFKKQKKDITSILLKEKEEQRFRIIRENEKSTNQLKHDYEETMNMQAKVWQDAVRECEKEINILRYEREQMDRNYCLEIDRLRTEFDKEKLELHKKHLRERDYLRKMFSDKICKTLVKEVR